MNIEYNLVQTPDHLFSLLPGVVRASKGQSRTRVYGETGSCEMCPRSYRVVLGNGGCTKARGKVGMCGPYSPE